MTSVSLASYSVRITRRGTAEHPGLGSFGKGSDLLTLFEAFLVAHQTGVAHDEEQRRLLRVRTEPFVLDREGRSIEAVIETGDYGYDSRLVDVDDEEYRQTHHRGIHEAELLPFYLLLHLPEESSKGILILQRLGSLGIRSVLVDALRLDAAFQEAFYGEESDHALSMNPLVPGKVIDVWSGAEQAKKIRLVSYRVPEDIARAFELGEKEEVYTELVIAAKRGSTLRLSSRLRRLLRGPEGGEGGVVEMQEEPAEVDERRQAEVDEAHDALSRAVSHDQLKLELDIGGRTRTVNAYHPGRMRAYHDVTDAVRWDPSTGHPSFESLSHQAQLLLEDLRRSIYDVGPRRRAAEGRGGGRRSPPLRSPAIAES